MEKKRDGENEANTFPENIPVETARSIIDDLSTIPVTWLTLAENPYPPYILVGVVSRAQITYESGPAPYSSDEFLKFVAGAIKPGSRCIEIAFLLAQEPDKVAMLKKRYDEQVAHLEANIVSIQTASLRASIRANPLGKKKDSN